MTTQPMRPPMSTSKKIWLSVAVVGGVILAACLGITAAALDTAESPPSSPTLAGVTSSPTSSPNGGWGADLAPSASPKASTPASPAAPKVITIEAGTWTVGTDVPAGTYRSSGVSSMCYWAITKTGTNGQDIVANDLPSGGRPQVTLKKGQDFETSDECGVWSKIK